MKLTANMEVEQNATLNTQKNTPTLLALSCFFSYNSIIKEMVFHCFYSNFRLYFYPFHVVKISEHLLSL